MGVAAVVAVFLMPRGAGDKPLPARSVRDWYRVTIDGDEVRLDVRTDEPWQASFRFDEVGRVCIKIEPDASIGVSHGIYVWIRGREHSYAIPLDADGGDALLHALTARQLLPSALVVQAMGSLGGLYCHPPE